MVSFFTINNVNASVGVCYEGNDGTIDCFNSNGTCEGTWSNCGSNGTYENGCTCIGIAPPCSDSEVTYLIDLVDNNWIIKRKDNGDVILTINSTIVDVEDFETVFQVKVIEKLKIVVFEIYDGKDLADGYDNKSEALLNITKVAFN